MMSTKTGQDLNNTAHKHNEAGSEVVKHSEFAEGAKSPPNTPKGANSSKVITPKHHSAVSAGFAGPRKKMKLGEVPKINYRAIMDEVVETVVKDIERYCNDLDEAAKGNKLNQEWFSKGEIDDFKKNKGFWLRREEVEEFADDLLKNKRFMNMVKSPVQLFDTPDKCICPVAFHKNAEMYNPHNDCCSPKEKIYTRKDLRRHTMSIGLWNGFLHQIVWEFIAGLERY